MKYSIIISGGNLLISDEWRKTLSPKLRDAPALGFVTTRVVIATSQDGACKFAIESALQELRTSSDVIMANDLSDPPTFEIVEINDLKDGDLDNVQRAGFTFYPKQA